MGLKDAKTKAIEMARWLPDGEVVRIVRMAPRKFDALPGGGVQGDKTVIMIHASWVRSGFYKRLGWH